jgi:nickel-dependent lactate racemase
MRVGIAYGREQLDVDVPQSSLVPVTPPAENGALADPAAAVRDALESPLGFPALRRALTPDDHVAVVVDESLPQLANLLAPVLEHITEAQVAPDAITVVCPPPSGPQPWVEALPDQFQEVRVEIHNPADRKRLSYLATTKQGRRIYLNRTVVDADQVVLLTRRGYDPLLGYSGAEGALFPALTDEATFQVVGSRLSMMPPGKEPWPLRREAAEVAWLLGVPFLVQVIEGTDSEVVHVLGGPVENSGEGQRLLDARWRVGVERPADVVVAGIGGDPARHTFEDLARGLACASRVVKPNGRIVLLTQAEPALGPGAELLRQEDEPGRVLTLLKEKPAFDREAAFQWASAAQQARLYVLDKLPAEVSEEMFATPLDNAGQVQRMLSGGESCLFLQDAHKTMALVRNP